MTEKEYLIQKYVEEVETLETQELKNYYMAKLPKEGEVLGGQEKYDMEQFLFWRKKFKSRQIVAPKNIRE